MSADIIAIPHRDNRHKPHRKSLTDMRHVPLAYQPPALTLPGERWHVNAYDLTQIIVMREETQRVVGRFVTARDAMAAAQSRTILESVLDARGTCGDDDAEFGRLVRAVLAEYGR